MNIVIIANFSANLDGSSMGRFTYLGEMLSARGHDVRILTSSFDHGEKTQRSKVWDKFKSKICLLYEPGYPNNVCLKRFYSHYIWGCNVKKYLDALAVKPDVVYCALPSLTAAVKTANYCRKNNVKFIVDIQDLWPESFAMVLKYSILSLFLKPFEWYVNKAYSAADVVVAVSDTYIKRCLAVNRQAKDYVSVFLGNDGDEFDKGKKKYSISHSKNEVWLAYIGTLGYSYDIPCVIDAVSMAAKHMPKDMQLKFVVMGDGPLRQNFERYAKEKSIYCEFMGKLPYLQMVGVLSSCDIAINPIIKGSAASIINKVGDYALAGLPVINTQECLEYRELVDAYQCGINCEVGNVVEVSNAIVDLVSNVLLRRKMGENSRKLGLEKFDKRETYKAIVNLF